jgi:hypothetical protein
VAEAPAQVSAELRAEHGAVELDQLDSYGPDAARQTTPHTRPPFAAG